MNKNPDMLPVLIFNAISPKYMGGVKRATDELVEGYKTVTSSPFFLIGKGKSTSNFFGVLKEFLAYRKKIKVIHFIVDSPYNVPFIILAKIFRRKIISTYHGNNLLHLRDEKNIPFFIAFWITDKIFRYCSDIITSPTQKLLDQLKINNKKAIIANLYHTVELETKSNNDQTKRSKNIVLITASNFDIKKKCEKLKFLFDAMNILENTVSNIELLVFGDGIHLDKLKKKYVESKNIIFMGFRKDFKIYLQSSDIYVHITGLDNQPYSIIDALMLKKVILCNEFDGMHETLDIHNNYLVKADSQLIAKKICSIVNDLQNDSKFQEKGERNRTYAIKRYSSDIIIPKYLEIYRKIRE